MVQIGTIEYEARVSGVAEAKQNAHDFAETQEDVAQSSEQAAASGGFLAGTLGFLADREEEAGEEADRTNTKVDVLSSGLYFAGTTAVATAAKFLGLSGALTAARGAATWLVGTLSGLTLSGVVGSVSGAISGFVTWLAAGSAGALAFAGAVGLALGTLGVWVLEVTGALKAVRGFGRYVGSTLPAEVRDGALMLLSVTAGPLAVFGNFIAGTVAGGFDEGFRRARATVDVFVGAWERQTDRIVAGAINLKNRAVTQFNQLEARGSAALNRLKNVPSNVAAEFQTQFGRVETYANNATSYVERQFRQMGSAIVGTVKQAWNTNIPARINFPSATIAGQTIGGGGVSIPRLQVGGMVEESGIAVVHEGESVIPEPLTSAASRGGGGGSGGGDVTVERVVVQLSGNFNPNDLSRRELQDLADKVASAIGKKTGATAGVR